MRTVDRRTGARAVGKMYLIDLAGSENVQQSGAAGKQLKEAIGINKSAPTPICTSMYMYKGFSLAVRTDTLNTFLYQLDTTNHVRTDIDST